MAIFLGRRVFVAIDLINSTELIRGINRDDLLANYFERYLHLLDTGMNEEFSEVYQLINRTGDGAIYSLNILDEQNGLEDTYIEGLIRFSCKVLRIGSCAIELDTPHGEQSVKEDFCSSIGISFGGLYRANRFGLQDEFFGRGINEAAKLSSSRKEISDANKPVRISVELYRLLTENMQKCFNSEESSFPDSFLHFRYLVDHYFREYSRDNYFKDC